MNTNPVVRNQRTPGRRTDLRRQLLSILVGGCFGTAFANPFGPQVVNGQASFLNQGNVLSVTNTPGAIINWQSFSINPGELTRFIQQNANSAVLNRITGQDPSQILGALQSNGRVFIVNPNGILFGQGAQVDVNGLVASTLNISNEDFLNGKMLFKAGDKAGNLKNEGAIATPAGGQVFLVAPNVENSGIITSPKGDVILAAGHTVQLVDSLNPDLRVVLSAPEHEALNLGQVIAQGGRTSIYGALVKQRGIINADSAVVGENGKVVLKASRDTLLESGSRTSATGAGKGGEIQVLGERVGLFGDTKINASGETGGGTILIGGDYQGRNPEIPNAKQVVVGKDAEIKADALGRGDGGKVIVWSDEATRFHGSISARGGQKAGNGGFVETSGKFLDMQGYVDTRAPHGATGALLLDPTNIYIASNQANATAAGMSGIDASADASGPTSFVAFGAVTDSLLTTGVLQGALASNDVTVSTTNVPGTGSGVIMVVDPISWSTPQTLNLSAAGGIAVNAAITSTDLASILAMRTSSGNITQSAAISVPSLFAYADLGTVSLTNSGNTVDTIAGWGGSAGSGFDFVNSIGLTIGTVNSILGTSHGVGTNNKPINITANSGNITINVDGTAPTYGLKAVSQTVTLTATNGDVTETVGVIDGGGASITAKSDITLTNNNLVGTFSANQTSSAGGSISFKNNAALTVTSVTQASTGADSISISTTGANSLTISGPVSAGSNSSVSLAAGTSGALGGTGTVTANTITLQSNSSGAIGAAGAPNMFQTSSSGIASITIGSTSGPSAVYLKHTGDATLNTVTLAANSTFDMSTTGDLVTTNINTGSANLSLNSVSGTLTNSAALAGGNVTLGGDKMVLSGGTVSAPSGYVALTSGSNSIHIATGTTDSVSSTLELSNAELNTVSAGVVRIGTTSGGPIDVKSTLGTSYSALSLLSGSTITQQPGALLGGATSLNLKGGSVTLLEDNPTGVIAGVTTGGDFQYRSLNGISVSTVDGTVGITVPTVNSIYLESQHAVSGISQTSPLSGGGLALKTIGPVLLNNASNSMAKLAADLTTGTGALSYKNSDDLFVDTVLGVSGVKTSNANITLKLAGDGSSQLDLGTVVDAGTGMVTLESTGSVYGSGYSPDIIAGNVSVKADGAAGINGSGGLHITAPLISKLDTASGSINVLGFSALTIGAATPTAMPAVSAPEGSVTITTSGSYPLTINGDISADGNINLVAGSSASSFPGNVLTINRPVTSTSGTITLGANTVGGTSVPAGAILQLPGSGGGGSSEPPPPTLSECTTNPALTGCGSVLPTLDTCTAAPTTAGCTAVLPTVDACVTNPTQAGCSAVLPTLSSCLTAPTTPGCNVVLPSLSACITAPETAGCSAVLPTLLSCTANPSQAGCSAVLPPMSVCVTAPTTAGCTAVLPTIPSCTANPSQPGCSTVLPPLSVCVTAPATAGCTAVLPTLTSCTSNPAQTGCSAVLPTLGSCTTSPNLAGCSAVLPSLSACAAAPTTAGCTAVLPTLAQCSANPAQEGCSVVVPTAGMCVLNPAAPECQVVLPITDTGTGSGTSPTNVITETVIDNTNIIVTTTAQASSNQVQSGGGSSSGGSGKQSESDSKKEDKKTTSSTDDSGAKKNEPAKKLYCN